MAVSSKSSAAVQQDNVLAPRPMAKTRPPRETANDARTGLIESFNGLPLPVYMFRGRACAIVGDVGRVLGYADDGRKLADRMREDWNDELIEGTDFDVLEGADLAAFKALTPFSGVSRNARSLTVLYRPGVNIVCLKTEKPLGVRLRRFLADEVMPKLERSEAIVPAAAPTTGLTREDVVAITTEVMKPTLDAIAKLTASIAKLVDGRQEDAVGGALLGEARAQLHIHVPLRRLADDMAAFFRAKKGGWRKHLTSLHRRIRKACEFEQVRGTSWKNLPESKLGVAQAAIEQERAQFEAFIRELAPNYKPHQGFLFDPALYDGPPPKAN